MPKDGFQAMGRGTNRLTVTALRSLKEPGFHADGAGLYVRVRETGGRSFVFVSTKGGKRRETIIGPVSDITLAEAREARDRLRRGEPADPQARVIPTFGEWAELWIAANESAWRNEVHRRQWRETFKTHAASLKTLKFEEVDVDAVLKVLRPIWSSHNETASRIRGRIERVLDAAKAKKYIVPPWENPARWRGNLEHLLPPRKKLAARGHQAAMPYEQLPQFIVELRSRPALAARALEFCILTASRTGEVLGADWDEVDLSNREWTVPGIRMKMGKPHRVPLTRRAYEILMEMQILGAKGYVFPGSSKKPLSNMAMMALLKRMGHADITVHGMRSAFRDFAGEETEHAEAVAEAALAHSIGDATVRAYRRRDAFDRRRRLMDDWDRYLDGRWQQEKPEKSEPSLVG